MFSKEQPRFMKNRHIVSKPAAAAKGPVMAAPNQKAVQANDNNRRALGDIGNLMGGLNAQCNINNDDVSKYYAYNLAGPAMAAPNQKDVQANTNNRRALGDIGNLVGGLNAQCNINNDDVSKYYEYKMAGPAMAAPNQKAVQANNNYRRAFGDIGNLVGGLNAQCNINNDDVRKSYRANLVVNANKGASSSTQQSQGGGIVARVEENARAGVVWGNRQSRTIRMKARYATATQRNSAISISDSIFSSSQDGGLKAPNELKATKPRIQSLTATLTARSEDSFRDVCEVLPSIDDGDLDNQLAVVEYVEDIYKLYRKIENMSCVPPDYMRRQLEIKENMRAILIDWLIKVHLKYNLMPETLYLTVNIIDRYLSIQSVTRKELQLVGITAMLIASKYEEIWPLKVSELVDISANEYTSKRMVDMERTILKKLKFNLTVPTPYVFVVRFLKAAGADKIMENLAFFLVDLCLLQYIMIKYSPSMLAAAAVYTAQCTLKKRPCWSKTLILHTGYSEADLKECAHFMVDFHVNAKGNTHKVVHKKYSDPFFGSVASLSPANIPSGTVAAPATNKCVDQTYFRKPY